MVKPKERVWSSVRGPVKRALEALAEKRQESEPAIIARYIEQGLTADGVKVKG